MGAGTMTLWDRVRGLLAGARPEESPPAAVPADRRPLHDIDYLEEQNRRRAERLDRLAALARVRGGEDAR